MKIGITGSSGFIGKHLVSALKKRKNVKLSYFDLPKNDLFNLRAVNNFVRNKDVIIHLAAVNRGKDLEIIKGGIAASHNLISAIGRSKKKTKLIFISSVHAETNSVFGQSKKLVEEMIRYYCKESKKPVAIFRLTNIFGEGCKPFYNSVVATFCYQVANNKKLTIDNPGQKINFIYVKDVVSLILKEVFATHKQPFYFKRVSSQNSITIKALANLIKSFKNKKPKLKSKFHKDLYNTYIKQ